MKLTLGQIADWIHAEGDFSTEAEAVGYSIDSRTIAAGELFFAVRGERMDGHDYVEAALRNGAVAAVVSRAWKPSDEVGSVDPCKLLWVPENGPPPNAEDNVLVAMQRLANHVRRAWGKRVIGITGSAGKTTTKEAVATVLSAQFAVLRSAGNLNNHFGVPLQLLRLEPEHEVAVIEMGMNHAGEIAALARIAEPNWGVVSNVGPVHLEFFPDGIDGIARAKKELVDALPDDGLAFLNADDARVRAMGDGLGSRAVLYGVGAGAEFRAEDLVEAGIEGVRFTVKTGHESAPVSLQLLGRHNVHNALAAIAVGYRSGMKLAQCAAAVAELRPSEKRGSLVEWRGATIVNDCYNSNPAALDAMVEALLAMTPGLGGRRIVIAGEMLELGPAAEELHAACGARMREKAVDVVIGVRGVAAAFGGQFFDTPAAAGEWMFRELREGDVVLLKASRGVKLEGALEVLLANTPTETQEFAS
jgi:UDP-N-acetylmuramoyl-tripeptide--D-alanyl-D-alanine ligase